MTARAITVEAYIDAPIEKIWSYWTEPEHIKKWNNASSDWHTPHASNDLRTGGEFLTRMESRDGSQGFDFTGTYTAVEQDKRIEYVMTDGRKVSVAFEPKGRGINVIETFDPESINPPEMQKGGWQAILDNFKAYVLAN